MMATAKPPIKVLLTIRQGQVGGGESHVLELVQNFNPAIIKPVVLSFTSGEMIDRLNDLNIENYVINTTRPYDIRIWGAVKDLTQNLKIDIVHAHGTRAASNTYWAAQRLKLPFLYTIHGWSFHKGQPRIIYNVRLFTERHLTRQTALNICVSSSNQQEGIERFGMRNSLVIYNGVNLSKFNPSHSYPNIRAQYNIPNDVVLIGFIARITHQKDPINFIKAIKELSSSCKDFRVLIIGDGHKKEEAVQLSRSLSLQDKIIFDGFRRDIPAVLQGMDIYCMPSLWEGFSIGLVEAMAMKKCVIASEVDGNKEIITNEVNGLFTSPGDYKVLAQQLKRVCENENLRNQLAQNAYQTVTEQFTGNVMTKKVEECYQNLLQS